MSTRATNEWKVGAFIVGLVSLLIVTLFWLGASRLNVETVTRVTYFDESVQGLEVGAPVKIRGVTIGKVSDIRLAPDRRLVEVHSAIRVEAMEKISENAANGVAEPDATDGEPQMRLIVAAQGITGVKFLEADFFPPQTPTIELSFPPPATYIPSAPSTLKSLEDAIRGLGEELPLALHGFTTLSATLEERVAGIDTAAITAELTSVTAALRGAIDGTAEAGIGRDLSLLVTDLREVTRTLNGTLKALGEAGGPVERIATSVESVAGSADAIAGDVERGTTRLGAALDEAQLGATTAAVREATADVSSGAVALAGDMRRALPTGLDEAVADLRRTLRRFERLAALLERDPGVLLRGKDGAGR